MEHGQTDSTQKVKNLCNPCYDPNNKENATSATNIAWNSTLDTDSRYCRIGCMDKMLSKMVKKIFQDKNLTENHKNYIDHYYPGLGSNCSEV